MQCEQIVAIDVFERVEGFHDKLSRFSRRPMMIIKDSDEIASLASKEAVDVILISIYQSLSIEILNQFPNLRAIVVLGTSTKSLPMEHCETHNVAVLAVKEYCDIETAEWTMMTIAHYFRSRPLPRSVFGRHLGIIGLGSVGRCLVTLARAFGMTVSYNARNRVADEEHLGIKFSSKEDIFSHADIVSFHTPPHEIWLNKDLLELAKKDLCIVNTTMGRLSYANDLEDFLARRDDVTLIMDMIAGQSYRDLSKRAKIAEEAAFQTADAQARLVEKFIKNVASLVA